MISWFIYLVQMNLHHPNNNYQITNLLISHKRQNLFNGHFSMWLLDLIYNSGITWACQNWETRIDSVILAQKSLFINRTQTYDAFSSRLGLFVEMAPLITDPSTKTIHAPQFRHWVIRYDNWIWPYWSSLNWARNSMWLLFNWDLC